jgi:hypothetical protein
MQRHLIIGGNHPTAVGNSLRHAAIEENIPHTWLDYDNITRASRWRRSFCWHVLNKRPPNLERFNQTVIDICRREHCDSVICAGNLSLTSNTLIKLTHMGIVTSIWLTDDPWNPLHLSRRFLNSLPHYGWIFTPRRSNLDQLNALAPDRVSYLPFGYDPRYFGPVPPGEFLHDVFFAGGADQGRAVLIGGLLHAGLDVSFYGAYWNRFAETRGKSSGYAEPHELSTLIARSRVALCLVRRSNRDGHSMRTFEIGAVGAPLLAEDTDEHREILGDEGITALYFGSADEMVRKCQWMIEHTDETRMMGIRLAAKIGTTANSYGNRFKTILSTLGHSGKTAPDAGTGLTS